MRWHLAKKDCRFGLADTNRIVAISAGACGDADATLNFETWGYTTAGPTPCNPATMFGYT